MSALLALLAAVRERHPARSVAVGGATWWIRDTAGPATDLLPLILLPGALGTGDVFYHLLDGLGSRRRIISASFPPIPDALDLAQSLVQLLDVLQLPKINLLGTSLGGYVAQVVALRYPHRIGKLILANTFYDPGLQQARWPAAGIYARRSAAEVLAVARLRLQNGDTPTPEHSALKCLMLQLVGGDQDAERVKAMRLAVLTAVPLERLLLSDADVSLIDDEHDPVIAAETRQQMRQRYAACRLFKIEGGGHFPASLQPQAYQDAVVAALSP